MIAVRGIPCDASVVWGWPWHGQLYKPDPLAEVYQLRRHNGELWPLYTAGAADNKINAALLFKMNNYALGVTGTNTRSGGTTHLVKTHGHVFAERTVEEVAADQLRSQEWLGATMMFGAYHNIYMVELGWYHWIYSLNGQRWQMKIVVDTVPHPTSSPTTALALTISARPFGMFDVPGAWEVCGSVSAVSCCTPGFSWFIPGLTLATMPPVMLQSIRSDGGELILEVKFWAMEPARAPAAAIGFYRLDVERVVDAWELELTRLKRDSEVIIKQITSNALALGLPTVTQTTSTPSDDIVVYTPEVIPSGDATGLYCVGSIVQEQVRHCGFVYDAADVLHELECYIRVSHACNVPAQVITVSGSATVDVSDPDSLVWLSNDILISEEINTSVATTLTVEMRRDGSPVSSVSSTFAISKVASVTRATNMGGIISGVNSYEMERTGVLTIGAHTASYAVENTGVSMPSGTTKLWPDAGIFSSLFFSSITSGTALAPWPSSNRPGGMIEQALEWRTYNGDGTSVTTNGYRIRLGAARLSNNVFVPAIVAGVPSAFNQWNQLSSGWSFSTINGLPASVFGERVGPDVNGIAPVDFVPVGGYARLLIEDGAYDYMHSVVTPYADIF